MEQYFTKKINYQLTTRHYDMNIHSYLLD